MGPKGLIEEFGKGLSAEIVEASREGDDLVLVIRPEALLRIMGSLKEHPYSYKLLLDLTCVDFRRDAGSFEMVYHLYSLDAGRRIRVKVRLPADAPLIDSLAGLWRNANWLEREVYDMFGVVFRGHPDLKRILMYDGFEGFPLRKDYPLRRRQPKADKGNAT
jgi:NADH-quinone oxidoreductase subunit C